VSVKPARAYRAFGMQIHPSAHSGTRTQGLFQLLHAQGLGDYLRPMILSGKTPETNPRYRPLTRIQNTRKRSSRHIYRAGSLAFSAASDNVIS
jgi:hypothetical protein